jgi:hypothetical protein
MKMKTLKAIIRSLIIFVMLISYSEAFSQTVPELSLDATIGWTLDLRLGAEVSVTDNISLRAEIGTSPFSLEGNFVLTYALSGIWYFTQFDNGLDLGILVGMPDGMIVFTENTSYMFSFGAAFLTKWEIGSGLYFNAHLGAGLPYTIDNGIGEWGQTSFWGLWPDARIGIGYNL